MNKAKFNPQDLILAASKVYGLDPLERKRMERHRWCRQAIYSILNKDYSLHEIAAIFDLTHATIFNGNKRFKEMMGVHSEYTSLYNRFLVEIGITPTVFIETVAVKPIRKLEMHQPLIDKIYSIPEEILESTAVKIDAVIEMAVKVHNRQKASWR